MRLATKSGKSISSLSAPARAAMVSVACFFGADGCACGCARSSPPDDGAGAAGARLGTPPRRESGGPPRGGGGEAVLEADAHGGGFRIGFRVIDDPRGDAQRRHASRARIGD